MNKGTSVAPNVLGREIFTFAHGTSCQFFIVTGNMILCIMATPCGLVQLPLTPNGNMSL